MSSLNEAQDAVHAAIKRGVPREEIVKLLAEYSTSKVCYLQAQYLEEFKCRCYALQLPPPPPPMPTPKFAVGDKVRLANYRLGDFTVIGYELRYRCARGGGEALAHADELVTASPEDRCTCLAPFNRKPGPHHGLNCPNFEGA